MRRQQRVQTCRQHSSSSRSSSSRKGLQQGSRLARAVTRRKSQIHERSASWAAKSGVSEAGVVHGGDWSREEPVCFC